MFQIFWNGSDQGTATSASTSSVSLAVVSGNGRRTLLDRVLIAIANSSFMSPIRRRWLFAGGFGTATRSGFHSVCISPTTTVTGGFTGNGWVVNGGEDLEPGSSKTE